MVNGGMGRRVDAQGGLEAAAAQGGSERTEDGRAGDRGQGRPAEGVEAVGDVGQRRLCDASQARPGAQVRLLAHVEHRRHPRQPPRDLRFVLPDGSGRVGGEEEDREHHLCCGDFPAWRYGLMVQSLINKIIIVQSSLMKVKKIDVSADTSLCLSRKLMLRSDGS